MRTVMKVRLPDKGAVYQRLGIDQKGDVQKYVTDLVFERLIPYIPKLSGELRSNAKKQSNTKIGVTGVYARAQFFGVTKKGKPFNYSPTGPKVGSHWDRRLIADEGRSIVAVANRYVRSRKR